MGAQGPRTPEPGGAAASRDAAPGGFPAALDAAAGGAAASRDAAAGGSAASRDAAAGGFPLARDAAEFETFRRDEERLRPGVRAVCERLGLGAARAERFADGSLPVYAVGEELVLKLFPPFDLQERDREARFLRALEQRLPVPTPGVRATGELEGWSYVLMERLRGQSLATAWPQIPAEDRMRLAAELGEALAVLHAVRSEELRPLGGDWAGFLAEQRRTAVERQRARGLGEPWLGQIEAYLEREFPAETRSDAPLHTEVMREHLLVERGPRGYRLSGLFDFEPGMIGAPEYEFASVGLFVSCAEPELLRALLRAYGYGEAELDAALERRLLAYALLHRYSHLPWYFRRLPAPAESTLEALASSWWGVRR